MRTIAAPLVPVLIGAIAALLPAPPAAAGGEIEVTVGQPNVWSLEQAHYLLARMHDRNDRLEAKALTADDLDPTAIHGARLDLLRTAMSLQVSSDQQTGLANEAAVDTYRHETARRRRAEEQLERLRERRLEVVREIASLERERARLAATGRGDGSAAAGEALAGEVAALGVERSLLDSEIEALSSGLEGTAPALDDLARPSGLDGPPPSLDGSAVEAIVDRVMQAPVSRLDASKALDAFVGLQYEIIAKQLTLLRDEAGPHTRVLFLELPQSIYSTPDSRNLLVRTEWRITRYCTSSVGERSPDESDPPSLPPAVSCPFAGDDRRRDDPAQGWGRENRRPATIESLLASCQSHPLAGGGPASSSAPRALELVPRSAELNVNGVHGRVRSWSLGALFSRLGFGANAGYRRQRELFERFVGQDVFASSYGRGDAGFGWTFGPKPGSRQIAPGDHTTYAVLAVPSKATVIDLEATATCFKRKRMPDSHGWSCIGGGSPATFRLVVPREETERFWLSEIDFASARPGRRITVFLRGENFSPQLGVLVDGRPLERVVRLALDGGDVATAAGGEYELVDSRTMVLTFGMGPGYVGTPHITLVAPGKTLPINYLPRVRINGKRETSLFDHSQRAPMFRPDPRIGRLRTAGHACPSGLEPMVIEGEGLRDGATLWINDRKVAKPSFYSPQRVGICVPHQNGAGHWLIRYFQHSTQRPDEAEAVVPSPYAPRVASFEVVEKNPVFRLHLRGRGLWDVTQARPLGQGSKDCGTLDNGVKVVSDEAVDVELKAAPKPPVLELCTRDGLRTVVDLRKAPKRPEILRLVNPETDAARGSTAGGYLVEVRGSSLGGVQKVTFGGREAKILHPTPTVVQVRAPAAREAGPVRVTVVTAGADGSLDNGRDGASAVFTYYEPPKS